MGYCNSCGQKIADEPYCPKCGEKNLAYKGGSENADVSDTSEKSKEKKKDSTLSIIAAICAFFTYTAPVGVILAIVDLCRKDGKRKLGSYFALIFVAIYIIVYFGLRR